jgi:hypothetical protein
LAGFDRELGWWHCVCYFFAAKEIDSHGAHNPGAAPSVSPAPQAR